MAEQDTVARPYAEAAFSLAQDSGRWDIWSEMLAFTATIAAHPEVAELVDNPRISDQQLEELFFDLSGSRLDESGKNLIRLLIQNGRLKLLPRISKLFQELRDDLQGILEAEVNSAFPLTDAQLASLVADLETRFRRKVHPKMKVDPELIGGVRIGIGDIVIDASARGRLNGLAAALRG